MIKLNLTNDQFSVIWELLINVRLGRDNRYTRAISDFMEDAESDFVQDLVSKLDRPRLSVEFNENEGLTFNLKE